MLFLPILFNVVSNRVAIDASTEIKDTLFSACRSKDEGGAIYCKSSDALLNLTSCSFVQCYSDSYGGAMAIRSVKELRLDGVIGHSCTIKSSASSHPYGSFAIMWGNSTLSKLSMIECSAEEASIGIHFYRVPVFIRCNNYTSNCHTSGYGSHLYFHTAPKIEIFSSVFVNNSCGWLLFEAFDADVRHTLFVDNACSRVSPGNYLECCFYNTTLPGSMNDCITDRIQWMTDYESCRFVMSSEKFTREKQSRIGLIMLLLTHLIL